MTTKIPRSVAVVFGAVAVIYCALVVAGGIALLLAAQRKV